jgi:hypothetical protein
MAGQFSFGRTEVCMHLHVSLYPRRTALLFVNPTSAFLPSILHARVATVIRSTVLLYCMICTGIWICQGKEKGYASTIPVHVPFSSAHQLMASWSQFPLTIRLPLKTKGMIVSSLHVQVGLFR